MAVPEKIKALIYGVDSYELALSLAKTFNVDRIDLLKECLIYCLIDLDPDNWKEAGGVRYLELLEFSFYDYIINLIEYEDGSMYFLLAKGSKNIIEHQLGIWQDGEDWDGAGWEQRIFDAIDKYSEIISGLWI